MKLSNNKVFFSGILLALLIFIAMVFFSYRQANQAIVSASWVAHTQEVLFHTEKLFSTATNIETGARAYLLTGQQQFLETFERSKEDVRAEIGTLKQLTSDNSSQQPRIDSLQKYITERIIFSDSLIRLKKDMSIATALQVVVTGKGKLYTDHIGVLIGQMQDEENRLLKQRKSDNNNAIAVQHRVFVYLVFIMLGLLVFIFWKEKLGSEYREREKSGKMFRNLLESAPDAMVIVNEAGLIMLTNQQTESLFGYHKNELAGKPVEILIPEELPLIHGHYREQFGKEPGVRSMGTGIELMAVKKGGAKFPVEISLSPLQTEEGMLVSASVRDITERKKSADRLKKSEEGFRLLVSNVKDYAIFMVDNNGLVASWNSGAQHIKGYAADEIIGRPIEVFYTKEDVKLGEPRHNLEMAREHGRYEREGWRVRKDGSLFFADVVFTALFDEKGNLQGYSKVTRDITEQKKAQEQLKRYNEELEEKVIARTEEILKNEKHFRALVENNYDIITLFDESFRIIYRSPSSTRILGWSNDEMKVIGGFKSIHPGESEKIEQVIRESMTKPGKPVNALFRVLHKHGQDIWLEGVVTNLLHDENVKAILFNFRDVTERIKSDEKIKQTLKELSDYKFALDESSIVAITDQKGVIRYANNNFCKISKYSRDELIGQDHRIINSGYHPKEFIRNLWTTISNGKIWKGELKNKARDGTIYWVDTTIVPFLDEKGKPYQYVAIRADITERKQVEEELTSSEMWFRSLIENSAEAIALTDEHSNNIYRSPAAQKIMGDVPTENTASLAHPDDLETIKNKHAEAIKNPGFPVTFQGRFLHASGYYIWLEGTLTNLLNVKGVNAVVTNYRDITQRKEAEEKLVKSEKIYKTIASSIPGSVICLLDSDYRYFLIEGDMIEKLGYSKEKLLGNRIDDVLDPEMVADIRNEFKKVFDGKTVTKEFIRFGYDTVSRYIPLKDENDVVYAIMSVSIDVTELKNAQRDITELNRNLEIKITARTDQLRKTNEELEAFSYSVSHDLRAPLRGIIGFSSILQDEYGSKLDNEAKRITSVIKDSAEKMGQLIDDLLNFSRMGRQEIHKAPVCTRDMVSDVIKELTPQAGERTIEWTIHRLPDCNVDMNTIKQVWINLISNAIKYSGKTTQPKIEIGSSTHNGQTTFFVKDNGAGFNEKYKNKLFKVFQRLHNSQDFEGTGVGLAIVEKIISKHGGRVWAEAEINKGATFYFSLPV